MLFWLQVICDDKSVLVVFHLLILFVSVFEPGKSRMAGGGEWGDDASDGGDVTNEKFADEEAGCDTFEITTVSIILFSLDRVPQSPPSSFLTTPFILTSQMQINSPSSAFRSEDHENELRVFQVFSCLAFQCEFGTASQNNSAKRLFHDKMFAHHAVDFFLLQATVSARKRRATPSPAPDAGGGLRRANSVTPRESGGELGSVKRPRMSRAQGIF
jgi:hypothetical protein